ncbi:hypothetical protein V2J09_010689 [Rumex salicifolius]
MFLSSRSRCIRAFLTLLFVSDFRAQGKSKREMKNNQIQNRSELPNRRSKDSSLKSSSDEAKKSIKIIKKSLNSAFTSVVKDDQADSLSYTYENSPIKETSGDNQGKESTENHHLLEDVNSPLLSASSKASMEADLSPSSVITTNESALTVLDGDEISDASRSEVEVEMVANYLKQARLQMLSSTGMDLRLKKLLDVLVDVTVKEFFSMSDERDWMDKIISAENSIRIICFLICLIGTSVMLLLRSGIGGSAYYPPPPT